MSIFKKILVNISPSFRMLVGNKKRMEILLERIDRIEKNIGEHKKITEDIFEVDNRKIIFQGDVDLVGNSRAFFNYLYYNQKNNYDFVWILQDKSLEHDLPKDIQVIYDSDIDFYEKVRLAKFVVCSTVQLFEKHKKQIGINLWHGTPIKTLGLTALPPDKFFNNYNNDFFFVPSDYCKLIFSACFRSIYERMFITGYPRNDIILENNRKISDLELVVGKSLPDFKKIVIYSPTFKSIRKWDGKPEISRFMNNIFYFDDYNADAFNEYLKEKGIILFVKPHSADEEAFKSLDINRSNIVIVYSGDLKRQRIQLYELFKFFDVMITDYSSIYADYLMLNRPIIFNHSTKENYSAERGFILEDNYPFFMPGPKVKSQKELLLAIDDALNVDSYKPEREKIVPLFNKYLDSGACARIFEIMRAL